MPLLLLLLLQLEIFGVLVKTLGLYQVPKLRKTNTTTTTIAAAATTTTTTTTTTGGCWRVPGEGP